MEAVSRHATEKEAIASLIESASKSGWDVHQSQHGITYAYAIRRAEGYPAREKYFVAAPEEAFTDASSSIRKSDSSRARVSSH